MVAERKLLDNQGVAINWYEALDAIIFCIPFFHLLYVHGVQNRLSNFVLVLFPGSQRVFSVNISTTKQEAFYYEHKVLRVVTPLLFTRQLLWQFILLFKAYFVFQIIIAIHIFIIVI